MLSLPCVAPQPPPVGARALAHSRRPLPNRPPVAYGLAGVRAPRHSPSLTPRAPRNQTPVRCKAVIGRIIVGVYFPVVYFSQRAEIGGGNGQDHRAAPGRVPPAAESQATTCCGMK